MKREYETSSFYLACYLATKGQKLIRLNQPQGSRRAYFVFEGSDATEKLVAQYMLNESVMIDAKEFVNQIRRLKSALYDGI